MPYRSEAHLETLGERERTQLFNNHAPIGCHPETGDMLLVSNRDRYSGTVITGVQGSGKSGLIENLIAYDVSVNHSVIVIDPHGDLIEHAIAQLPGTHLSRAYLLNMTDEAYPFGVNVFSISQLNTEIAQAQSVGRVMHIFQTLWPETESQQYLPRYLRAAIITLFCNPGSTLVDMYRLLTDDDFRQQLLKNVPDHTVQTFWQAQYDELAVSARTQRVGALVGRLESLFMGRSLVRNIVGQSDNTIDFRKAIEERQVIFIKLPLKVLAQDARLIGTMLIAQIHAALFSFADLPEQQRPGFSLYVDEFQHFATPDFSEMFTEGRKFGVRVTVAHQYRGQLPEYLQASTMTARTKVCFQLTPEDSRTMAHLFPGGESSIKPEDIDPKPVEHLLTYGSNNPHVQTFIDYYLRPLQAQRKGGTVEIQYPGVRWEHWLYWLTKEKPPADKPKVADPTPYLNHLLYQTMKTQRDDLPIPAEVVYGFSNCGRGFYSDFKYSTRKGALLSVNIQFPPALVIEKANGDLHWTRPPETGQEQLLHFLFFLRMLMIDVVYEPIGKRSTVSVAEVAQMLTQLPRRAAFVRSGDEISVIYTHNTLPMVVPAALQERLTAIQTQTRQKYCQPKDQRAGELAQQTAPASDMTEPAEEPKLSRWEEV